MAGMTKIDRLFRSARIAYEAAAEEARLIYESDIMEAEQRYNAAADAAQKSYLSATWSARQQEGRKRAHTGFEWRRK